MADDDWNIGGTFRFVRDRTGNIVPEIREGEFAPADRRIIGDTKCWESLFAEFHLRYQQTPLLIAI